MSYQQCTRFWTIASISGTDQTKSGYGVINCNDSHVRWHTFGEIWSANKKYPWPWNSIKLVPLLRYMFMQKKSSECRSSLVIVLRKFLFYFAIVKNPKIRSSDHGLWILWVWSIGAVVNVQSQGMKFCSCKISWSWMQQFMSSSANREKTAKQVSAATADSKNS